MITSRSLFRPGVCLSSLALLLGLQHAPADDWPQWLGPQRDGVWRETGIVEKFPDGGPKVRWRVPIGGGYAGPAVAGGRVYVTDRVLAPNNANPASGFDRRFIRGGERVLCLNEADGRVSWQHEYDCPYDVDYPAGPRATPVVHQGKVYALGTMGNLFCLDTATGKEVWSRDFKKDFAAKTPAWGFAAHPLIDGRKLICLVGGEGSVAVAFDKDTGKELWRALSAPEPGYCPPMLHEFGGKRQLIIWHPASINALDPETGDVRWSQPCSIRSGLSIPTPRKDGDRLFLTSFYEGPMLLEIKDAQLPPRLVWRGQGKNERNTDGLHAIMCTPFLEGGYIYGVCSYGQFRCLKADTGERVWETFEPTGGKEARWANCFIVKNGDRFFLFSEKGDLIIAKLAPEKYVELSRAHLLNPSNSLPGREVVWSHPAFANRSVYARNDKDLVCVSLAAGAVK
ncbi:MAG: PQQ-like beta-propeller repeat protein [Verrucomicrobia bacterium]|nr:PQQ-like beta-propeller repeat protein [Verrucomicrobiota bacterium]